MAAFPVRFSSPPLLLHPPPTLPQLSLPYFRCPLSKLALDRFCFPLTAPLSRCFRSSSSWGTGSALFAVYEDDGEGLPRGYNHNLVADTATAVAVEASGVAQLKQALIDTVHDTDRGLTTSSETRGEIVELITQLEAKNPTPTPTEALALLHGRWILAYSSLSELFPLLSAGNLPLVKVGKISQTIDLSDYTFVNSVTFSTPLGTASFGATASFQICSPKRVQIMFEEGIIGSPQLTASIEMPESIDFLGQKLDLTQLQGPFQPLQTAAYSIARTISGQPPLKFPLRTDNTQSWLVTTYLDEDLRITRGDGGTVFVLIKEDTPLSEL